jgi:hypothetical protein
MAIIMRGRTKCPICGRVHGADEALVLLPPSNGFSNELQSTINDAGLHLECALREDVLAEIKNRASWWRAFVAQYPKYANG